MFTEFSIGANFGIFLCHADVSFVYKGSRIRFLGWITPGVVEDPRLGQKRCEFVDLEQHVVCRREFVHHCHQAKTLVVCRGLRVDGFESSISQTPG